MWGAYHEDGNEASVIDRCDGHICACVDVILHLDSAGAGDDASDGRTGMNVGEAVIRASTLEPDALLVQERGMSFPVGCDDTVVGVVRQ